MVCGAMLPLLSLTVTPSQIIHGFKVNRGRQFSGFFAVGNQDFARREAMDTQGELANPPTMPNGLFGQCRSKPTSAQVGVPSQRRQSMDASTTCGKLWLTWRLTRALPAAPFDA
jgi:hypothetical protein